MSMMYRTRYVPIQPLLVSSIQGWFDTHTGYNVVVSTRRDDPQVTVPLEDTQIVLKMAGGEELANGAARSHELIFAILATDEDEAEAVADALVEAIRTLPSYTPLSFAEVTALPEQMDSPSEFTITALTGRAVQKASEVF